MTAKNKNDSNRLSYVYVKRLVAFFLVSLSCPVWLVLLVVVVGFIDSRLFRYQKADVLETCALLKLPADSRFCLAPADQTPDSLQEVLKEAQSALPTTMTELKALVQTEMRCFEEGPDQVCRLYLPVEHTSLWILYTTDDTIKRYEVYFSN